MKIMYSALAVIAIILSMAIILPTDLTQTADAAKSSGVKTKQFGHETKTKVCGDRLCTPDDFTEDKMKKQFTPDVQASVSLQTMMSKMERLFEMHRTQLTSAWDSLSHSEKSNMMNMMDKMYEKMKSMDFRDHMKHMSSMMDDKHHDCQCDEQGCTCGEGEHDGMCKMGEEGCNCSEDGVCTCGEGCTCASCH